MRAFALIALVSACGGESSPAATASSPAATASIPPPRPAPVGPPLEAAPGGPKGTGTLPFRWSDGRDVCRIPATQYVEKKGIEAELTFTGVLTRDGDNWTFDMVDMTMVSVGGRAPTEAERQGVAGLIIPTTVIDADGAFVEMRGLDEMVERLLETNAVPEAVAAQMRTPGLRAIMAEKAGDTWNGFAGAFLGADLGETFSLDVPRPMADGTTLPTKVTFVHHGPVVGRPDLQLFSLAQLTEGEAAATWILERVGAMAPDARAAMKDKITSAEHLVTITAAIDPLTGRTHRARSETNIRVNDLTRREVRDTAFDWARSTGCGT